MSKRFVVLLIPLIAVVSAGGCGRPFRVVAEGDLTTRIRPDNSGSRLARWTLPGTPATGPAVAVIDVDGLLINHNLVGMQSLGENPVALFREKLEAVAADPEVRAVVIRINSPGGGVTASDIMRRELQRLKERRQIPAVACLVDVGAGGGYYLATAADLIVAHPTCVVGGVGVIFNAYNLQDTLGQFNVVPLGVKAGEKIDMASPVRGMEAEEREILQTIADQMHERFRVAVRGSRPAAAVGDDELDGRVWTAEDALARGLVDATGYLDDALAAAASAAGCGGRMRVVMYRRDNDRAHTPYDVTPNVPVENNLLPISIPGLERSSMPNFLYLWQPDPSYWTRRGGP